VQAVLADHTTAAGISDQVRAALGLLQTMTLTSRGGAAVTVDDIRAVLATGATRAQVEDALYVGYCFNVITRLADTFEFFVGSPEVFAAGARMLLKRGYKL
jgi:alkylhydroperoxidase family enzyme